MAVNPTRDDIVKLRERCFEKAAFYIDYTGFLTEIATNTAMLAEFGELLTGIMVFFLVVCLCYFAYKFLRIFI